MKGALIGLKNKYIGMSAPVKAAFQMCIRDSQDSVRWAMRDLMYIPFEFENSGTRVIHYTPETYDPGGK